MRDEKSFDFGFWIMELSPPLLAQAGAPKERQVEGLRPFWFLVMNERAIGTHLIVNSLDNCRKLGITITILFMNGLAILPVDNLKLASVC
jgi:hypothetical protein